jgi:hypothetical protein
MPTLDDDIHAFDVSVDKASQQLEKGGHRPDIAAILSVGVMISKALVLLARSNRMVSRS